MSANINPFRKILILRFSSIGDIVLTSPIIRCLKTQLDCKIDYLVKNKFKDTLKANPHIDEIIGFEKEPQEVLEQLKTNDYDFIVDLHKNIRTRRLLLALAKPSANFPKKNIQKWLLVNFKVNKMPDLHIVDRYFEAVKALNVQNDRKGLEYFIPEADEVDLTQHGLKENEFIAFGFGAAHQTKALPLNKAKELLEKLDQKFVLLGGPMESAIGAALASSQCLNFCGKLNINQTASLIRQAGLVISPDTGIMHIAAAFRKKAVSFWGNTVPDFGMYPYYGKEEVSNLRSEVKGLSCRPCSKIGYKNCPKGHFKCMQEQDMEAVKKWVQQVFL